MSDVPGEVTARDAANPGPPTDGPAAAPVGAQATAERVVAAMLAADAFTRWLGAELVEVGLRRCVLRMAVRADMVNGFGICHGGVTFALADSAFAFACNTHGAVNVALDCSVSYPNPAHVGDVLTAVAETEIEPRRVGFYGVTVTNARGESVALFRGTAYDTRRPHTTVGAVGVPVRDTARDGTPAVVIRPATLADAATIARHRASMYRDLGRLDAAAFPALVEAARRWVEAAMAEGRYFGWLADVADEPGAGALHGRVPRHVVGGAGVEVRTVAPRPTPDGRGVETAPQALVRDVYVVPAWRGRGVARRLMEGLLAWAAERTLSGVVLHASEAGRPLYERLGFVPTNEMRHAP